MCEGAGVAAQCGAVKAVVGSLLLAPCAGTATELPRAYQSALVVGSEASASDERTTGLRDRPTVELLGCILRPRC